MPPKAKQPKGTQVKPRAAKPPPGAKPTPVPKSRLPKGPCPWLCNLVPNNVPAPGPAQAILHPRKDVFLLKVAKVGASGDRRCKMELELVTPKYPERRPLCRIDTRETQCDPDPPPCLCCRRSKRGKSKSRL